MKVILLSDIPKLGRKHEVKNVSGGYARNFLFPRGLAMVLTSSAVLELEKQDVVKQAEVERELVKSQALARKLDGLEVEIAIKVAKDGDSGYAAVSTQRIAETLQKLGFEVKKNQIEISEPIKKLGEYLVKINLAHQLEAEIKIIVVPEKAVEQR